MAASSSSSRSVPRVIRGARAAAPGSAPSVALSASGKRKSTALAPLQMDSVVPPAAAPSLEPALKKATLAAAPVAEQSPAPISAPTVSATLPTPTRLVSLSSSTALGASPAASSFPAPVKASAAPVKASAAPVKASDGAVTASAGGVPASAGGFAASSAGGVAASPPLPVKEEFKKGAAKKKLKPVVPRDHASALAELSLQAPMVLLYANRHQVVNKLLKCGLCDALAYEPTERGPQVKHETTSPATATKPCKHVFCRPCLEKHERKVAPKGLSYPCPAKNCKSTFPVLRDCLPLHDILFSQNYLGEEKENEHGEAVFLPIHFHCPTYYVLREGDEKRETEATDVAPAGQDSAESDSGFDRDFSSDTKKQSALLRYGCPVNNLTYPQLALHAAFECEYRKVSCEFCSTRIRARDLLAHHQTQCEGMAPCLDDEHPDGCTYQVPSKELEAHRKNDCNQTFVQCDEINCPVKVRRSQLTKHKETEWRSHTALSAEVAKKATEAGDLVGQKFKKLSKMYRSKLAVIELNEAELASMKTKIAQLEAQLLLLPQPRQSPLGHLLPESNAVSSSAPASSAPTSSIPVPALSKVVGFPPMVSLPTVAPDDDVSLCSDSATEAHGLDDHLLGELTGLSSSKAGSLSSVLSGVEDAFAAPRATETAPAPETARATETAPRAGPSVVIEEVMDESQDAPVITETITSDAKAHKALSRVAPAEPLAVSKTTLVLCGSMLGECKVTGEGKIEEGLPVNSTPGLRTSFFEVPVAPPAKAGVPPFKWTTADPSHTNPSFVHSREAAASVQTDKGFVVCGGVTSSSSAGSTVLATMEIFTEGRWLQASEMGQMNQARCLHAITVFEGRLWVFGGCDNQGRALSSVESFDWATKKWSWELSLPHALFGHHSLAVGDSLHLVSVEDNKHYCYTAAEGWFPLPSILSAAAAFSDDKPLVLVPDADAQLDKKAVCRLLVLDERTRSSFYLVSQDCPVQKFDTTTSTWELCAWSLPHKLADKSLDLVLCTDGSTHGSLVGLTVWSSTTSKKPKVALFMYLGVRFLALETAEGPVWMDKFYRLNLDNPVPAGKDLISWVQCGHFPPATVTAFAAALGLEKKKPKAVASLDLPLAPATAINEGKTEVGNNPALPAASHLKACDDKGAFNGKCEDAFAVNFNDQATSLDKVPIHIDVTPTCTSAFPAEAPCASLTFSV